MLDVAEGVGDVFEEDEAEDNVLIFRRVHVVAELSAASQRLASKPRWAVESAGLVALGARGMSQFQQ